MKLKNLYILQILLLITLLITAGMSTYTVIADDHEDTSESEDDENDEQESDDDDLEDDEREVKIEHSDDKVSIESENENENREDEFEAEISTDGDAEIKIEYSTESDSTESESEMKVEFFEIIEFNDTDSDGVYNESVDTEIQTYEMSDVGYKPLKYTTEENSDGATKHIITMETNDDVFKVVVYIVGQMTDINGTDLKPTSLKFDIIITNFNFQESDSKLALYTEVESTSEVEREDDDVDDQVDEDEDAVAQQGEGIFAFYSWKKTADVDGQTTNVLSSYEEKSATERKLYLNYEHGNEIVHDPKLGFSINNGFLDIDTDSIMRLWPDVSPALMFGISIVAAITFIAIPTMLYKRKQA